MLQVKETHPVCTLSEACSRRASLHGLDLTAINSVHNGPTHSKRNDEDVYQRDDRPFTCRSIVAMRGIDCTDSQHASGDYDASPDHTRSPT